MSTEILIENSTKALINEIISIGLRLAATTIQLQPIPVIAGQQLSNHIILETATKFFSVAPGMTAQTEVAESSSENPLDVAMREINEGFAEEKLGFEREPDEFEPCLGSWAETT